MRFQEWRGGVRGEPSFPPRHFHHGYVKAPPGQRPGGAFMYPRLFLGDDGAVGAGVAAGTAVQASGSVDDVSVIALADGAGGAGVRAGTAADACRSNLVGHGKHLH